VQRAPPACNPCGTCRHPLAQRSMTGDAGASPTSALGAHSLTSSENRQSCEWLQGRLSRSNAGPLYAALDIGVAFQCRNPVFASIGSQSRHCAQPQRTTVHTSSRLCLTASCPRGLRSRCATKGPTSKRWSSPALFERHVVARLLMCTAPRGPTGRVFAGFPPSASARRLATCLSCERNCCMTRAGLSDVKPVLQ